MTSLPSVGVLFLPGQTAHLCTASVVDSTSRDVVLTAAHCLAGTGAGFRFVPGYGSAGTGPAGSWSVTAAFVDPAWRESQEPLHDYAFLTMAPQQIDGHPRLLQDVVGTAERVGAQPASGAAVRLFGYRAGRNDRQLSCSARTYRTGVVPTVYCPGFGVGTSGAPWLLDSSPSDGGLIVVGLIGGLHQGGCSDDTSSGSGFDADAADVLRRASAGGAGDTLPVPGDDGC